jgi:transposase
MDSEPAILDQLRQQNAGLVRQNAELVQRNAQLVQTAARLTDQVGQLTREVGQLREQLEQAQSAAARQAAPFRRPERLKVPSGQQKKPGRPVGHPGAHRKAPPIDHQEVVALPCCPQCGGAVHDAYPVEQIIEEIPPVKPVVYKIVTYRATCRRCGEVCSRHPLQTSDATGAAGVHLGPRAIALATALNKHHGLTMRRTCKILRELAGLDLTAGGLSQMVDRVADRVECDYEALINRIRGSPAVNADETSWWVGGPGWWLWTFTCPEVTVYRVDHSRSAKVVEQVLGENFAGVLVSDCLSSYDVATYRKHKCIAHHLRAIEAAKRLPTQSDPSYLRQWTLLLKSVIVLHRLWQQKVLNDRDIAAKRVALEAWIDQLLAHAPSQGGDARIRNRLAKQRRHLLGCLTDIRVEPTNNRAERSLRPAVIARKLSCGNKTDRGRRSWEVLASLGATHHQTGQDFVSFLAHHVALAQVGR